MDAARMLILAGAAILGVLGSLPLAYTCFGDKLLPRDAAVIDAMKATTLVITRQTTVWEAWIGFNASHSLGAILFAAVYILLAAQHWQVLARSPALLLVGVATTLSYLWLPQAYWFRGPFTGIAIAAACFIAATALVFI